MLLTSLLLLVAAILVYTQLPSMLIYWTYPLPVYALLIGSVAFAVASRRRGVLPWVAVGATGLIAVLFIAYTAVFSRLDTHELSVNAGDPFPEFTLATSTGGSFSPSELKGKKAALYVFYRGDW
jgi:peptidoglycan/LPS O-acetylase OafA/YrhL